MAPAPLETVPGWARSLLQSARVARLGLLDDQDLPRVLPVTYAVCAGSVVSAVDDKPKRVAGGELARVRFLRRSPATALTVDRYDDDWDRLAWVQLLGETDVLDTVDAEALEALQRKYPPYGERPPGGPFLRLRVDRAIAWRAAG